MPKLAKQVVISCKSPGMAWYCKTHYPDKNVRGRKITDRTDNACMYAVEEQAMTLKL